MKIYGIAILAGCYLVGKLLGDLLGILLNINGNVGGVGFGMALLIASYTYLQKKELLPEPTASGIKFWGAIYIPVIVAMSATQNVKAALTGGWVALAVGILATGACFFLVPVISQIGKENSSS